MTTSLTSWKRLFAISAGFGVGFAVCAAAIVAAGYWYMTRPKPPKPWNATALTVSDAPSFVAYGKELHIHLRYDVQNHTNYDYSISKFNTVRLMGRYPDGSFTTPLDNDAISIEDSVFIPAQHTGTITLNIKGFTPVAQEAKQSDEQYHEQLRSALNTFVFDGFTIFDEGNRYQINLPKWLGTMPTEKAEAKPPTP